MNEKLDKSVYKICFESEFGSIYYVTEGEYLLCYPKGVFRVETIKKFGEAILKEMETRSCSKVMIHFKGGKGSVSDANNYLKNSWLPRAYELGLRASVFVLNADVFSIFSLNFYFKLTKPRSGHTRKVFQNFDEAHKWMKDFVPK